MSLFINLRHKVNGVRPSCSHWDLRFSVYFELSSISKSHLILIVGKYIPVLIQKLLKFSFLSLSPFTLLNINCNWALFVSMGLLSCSLEISLTEGVLSSILTGESSPILVPAYNLTGCSLMFITVMGTVASWVEDTTPARSKTSRRAILLLNGVNSESF